MKILLATGIFPPDAGGPATYGALLVKHLEAREHKVRVATYGSAGVSRKIPKGIRHIFYFFACLWHGAGADIIFAQDTVSAGFPAALAAKLLRKKFVLRVPGDYAWEQGVERFGVRDSIDVFSRFARSPEERRKYSRRVRSLLVLQRFVANFADVVIAPSKYFQKMVQRWVRNPRKVLVIYNGIEMPKKDKGEGEETVIRPNHATKYILSAGRLVPWKGFETLIALMGHLLDYRLLIAGDGPEQKKLESMREASTNKERIELLGRLPRKQLMGLLHSASVFVLNTSFESFSFQILEAMAAGVPVVATAVCNIPEIIENGREGILVRPDDEAAIIAAIRRFENESFRAAIISAASTKAEQFSIERTISELENLFNVLKPANRVTNKPSNRVTK